MSVWFTGRGLLNGVLTTTRIAVPISPAAAIQIFDSSIAARTPRDDAKTVIIQNISTSAGKVFIGGSDVSTTVAAMLEVESTDPPVVIDLVKAGMPSLYVVGTAAANILVSQLG